MQESSLVRGCRYPPPMPAPPRPRLSTTRFCSSWKDLRTWESRLPLKAPRRPPVRCHQWGPPKGTRTSAVSRFMRGHHRADRPIASNSKGRSGLVAVEYLLLQCCAEKRKMQPFPRDNLSGQEHAMGGPSSEISPSERP